MASVALYAMAKPSITIEPLREEETDAFINLYCTAFAIPEADMIMPMMYPMGLKDPKVLTRLRSNFPPFQDNRTDSRYLAKNAATGEIIGLSWWKLHSNPPSSTSELESAIRETKNSIENAPPVPGMNMELAKIYSSTAFIETYHLTQGKPFVELRMLAIHPNHQGKGVGSMLMREGLKKADETGLPCFVISSIQGKPVYEKYGFSEVVDFPLDCRDYGGKSRGDHWTMLRPVQSPPTVDR